MEGEVHRAGVSVERHGKGSVGGEVGEGHHLG